MPIQPSTKALARDASQAYASAATYGRRIALLAILGLAPVDPKERDLLEVDDDGNTASGKSENVDPKFEADYTDWLEELHLLAEQPASTEQTLLDVISTDHASYGDQFRLRLKSDGAVAWTALKATLPKKKA